MQEVLQKLKRHIGFCGKIIVPDILCSSRNAGLEICSTEDSLSGVYHIGCFVDFSNLLRFVKDINRNSKLGIKVTPFRFLLWKIGSSNLFYGKKILVPVDLHEKYGFQRTLGFIIVRPSIFISTNSAEKDFLRFQAEINRQVDNLLMRRGESYELIQTYGILHPSLYNIVLAVAPHAVREFAGIIGVSLINRADIFVAPYTDVHTDGFISFSNFFTSAVDGRRVCYVSIKGPSYKIREYLSEIEHIAAASGF
jgi:hypothetical protein